MLKADTKILTASALVIFSPGAKIPFSLPEIIPLLLKFSIASAAHSKPSISEKAAAGSGFSSVFGGLGSASPLKDTEPPGAEPPPPPPPDEPEEPPEELARRFIGVFGNNRIYFVNYLLTLGKINSLKPFKILTTTSSLFFMY